MYLIDGNQTQNNNGVGSMYFLGNNSGVGMNKNTTPESILDIYGYRSEVLNVFSNQSYTKNILARNKFNYGITLSSDSRSSNMNFYHSDVPINSIYDNNNGPGQIKYEPSGNMIISVPSNFKILSRMIVSDRPDKLSVSINNETATIYDNSNSIYLPDIYNNLNIYSGNALSLVSSDTNSTTFLNITTNEQMGWKWGGGVFPMDSTRNMGTMGYIDENNKYIPSETIISGNSLVKNRFTIGVNTYSPKTEKYIMDINGPISIQHQELHLIQTVNYEINSISFSQKYNNFAIAIGKSNTINNSSSIFNYSYLLTTNSGHSWTELPLIYENNTIPDVTFKTYCYDPENIIISSNRGFVFYSLDSGINFNFVLYTFPNTQPSIYMTNNIQTQTQTKTQIRTFIAYPSDIYNNKPSLIYYFDNYNSNTITNFKLPNNFDIYCIAGYNNTLFVAGGNNIAAYNISPNDILFGYITTSYQSKNKNIFYKAIYTLDGNYTIAVGNDIITYTTDNGNTWTDILNINADLNDIYIWNNLYAIAVGDAGTIYYTTDGYITWHELNVNQLNGMGNGANIINPNVNIKTINMNAIDTFILSCVTQSYNPTQNQTGNTNLYYLHLPDLFDRSNHSSILDICGNMIISGDIHINDSGKLQTNNETFYLLDKTANTIYFARDASNIFMGDSIIGGTTYINHQLDVSDNTFLHQNLVVDGIETIQNTTNTIDLSSGALQVYGGISVKKNVFIGGNNVIYGDISLNGNEYIQGNLKVNTNTILGNSQQNTLTVHSKSFFINDVSINTNLFVIGDVSFNNNLYIRNNADICNNMIIRKDLSVQNNTILFNKLQVMNDVSLNNNLSVANDTSLNGILNVNKNAFFNTDLYIKNNEWVTGNINIGQDISLNRNQYIGNNLFVANDISSNGNVFLNGNVTIGSSSSNLLNIKSKTNFVNDVSFSTNVNIKQLVVTTDQTVNGNLFVKTSLIPNALRVLTDSSFVGNVNVDKNVYCSNIYTTNIGSNSNSSIKQITIGALATQIIIGGDDTNVVINGTQSGSISNTSNAIILSKDVKNASTNAGLYIYDDDDNHAAFFATNYNGQEIKFKAPKSRNIVSINIHDISLNLKENNNGILTLNSFYDINQSDLDPVSHQINVSSFDISNILQRSMFESNATKQVILTDVSIKGNVIINKSITNTNYALDVSGNISHSNGWISQF